MKIILPKKLSLVEVCKEFEYMQQALLSRQDISLLEDEKLFVLLYNAIDVALYYQAEQNEAIEHHVQYLVSFAKTFLIDTSLNVQSIRQLHSNILPPGIQSNFIYDAFGSKIQKIQRGEYRTINTYLKDADGREVDFVHHEDIEEVLVVSIDRYNGSQKKIDDIAHFILDFYAIHPFMDGNGKVARVLLDILLIKSNYYPSFYHKSYRKYQDKFQKIYADYTSSKSAYKEQYIAEFISALLRPVYKENYFS